MGQRKPGKAVDPEQLARRALGMPPSSGSAVAPVDGVTAAHPRPCVGCGRPTSRLVFNVEHLRPGPARCEACEEASWDVAVELVDGREQAPGST